MTIMKRITSAFLAFVLVLAGMFTVPALAAEPAVITLNVSNTPVRGDVILKKTGLQLVRFEDQKDSNGYTIMKHFLEREHFLTLQMQGCKHYIAGQLFRELSGWHVECCRKGYYFCILSEDFLIY